MAQEDLIAKVAAKLPQPEPAPDAEQVTTKREGDVLEARSTSRRIKTVEDLLRHIEADLERYEVAASEATKWECASSDGKGGTTVTELHRVFVRLKPKAGPTTREVVEAMIAGAVGLKQRPVSRHKKPKGELWQVIVVADTHFGKRGWHKTTGQPDYDLDIAATVVGDAAAELIAIGNDLRPSRRTVLMLGDLFHFDNPKWQTTGGTQLDGDGRLQKVIEQGSETLLGIVEQSASSVPTDVHIVNGNHDETLTAAFQRIMFERFRKDQRVAVSMKFTSRQYVTHGANLLGIAHGHKAKKRLPQLMALEAAGDWARCPYREYHTGHYHSQAAEWQRPIETIDGVLVRTAPSIGGTDEWHADGGFIGARRAMETFLYRPEGGLTAMHVAGVKP
jgi:UDP-2,3-diacylglucosamine pyrophosphatase LpxH